MTTLDMKILQHYMFTKKHIMQLSDNDIQVCDKKTPQVLKQVHNNYMSQDNNFISQKYEDTLFWCFYIITRGLFKYETLGNTIFKVEKSFKIELVEILRNFKELLKKNKWKRSHIENELVVEKKITLSTLFCICAIKGINMIVAQNRCVHIQENSPGTPFELIVLGEHGFMISQHPADQKQQLIDNYMTDYWIIENINKPLLAISKYKVDMLREICKKLKIPIVTEKGKKYTKKVLYNMISCKI